MAHYSDKDLRSKAVVTNAYALTEPTSLLEMLMAPMQSFVPQVRLAVPVSGLTFAARVIPSAITLVPRQPHLILPPLLFSLRLLPGACFSGGSFLVVVSGAFN